METLFIIASFLLFGLLLFLYSAYRKKNTDYKSLKVDYDLLLKQYRKSQGIPDLTASKGGNPHPGETPFFPKNK